MKEITLSSNKNIEITASTQEKPRPASWFAELVIMSQIWIKTGLLRKVKERVRVERGRMGTYEAIDYILILLGYGTSNEGNLKIYFSKIRELRGALASLWEREESPSQAALSRFLEDVKEENVGEMRKIMMEDMLENGIQGEYIGGVYDQINTRHIVFDVDATVDAARQRSVVSSADYPQVKRRRKNYGKGYRGRKRGEVVRSRTTIQQAHTQEWLGSFGTKGNPEHFNQLEKCCWVGKEYMKAHSMQSQDAILRMDGQYGWARAAYTCQKESLGYLMRCSDYRFIEKQEVKEKIQTAIREKFYQLDTQTSREIVDCGFIEWKSGGKNPLEIKTRLILAISQAPKDITQIKVGKLKADKVIEMFVTNQSSQQFSAKTLLSLYFARGGFEQTFSQEESENNPDRFCSQHHWGQEFWQLICLWVWNARLRLGFIGTDPKLRRTLWDISHTQDSSFQTQETLTQETLTQEIQSQGNNHQDLSLSQSTELKNKEKVLEITPQHIYWDDLEACSLRRFLPNILLSQHLEITFPKNLIPISTPFISRDQRAHRRLSWSLRLNRNRSKSYSSPWGFFIFGLPIKLSSYLSNINSMAA
jgi:hypothetical protein